MRKGWRSRQFWRAAQRGAEVTGPIAYRAMLERMLEEPVRAEAREERRATRRERMGEALLTPREQAIFEKARGLKPGEALGVRARVAPTLFPRPARATRDALSKLLQEQRTIYTRLGDEKWVRKNPEKAKGLWRRIDRINKEIDSIWKREFEPLAEMGPGVAAPAWPADTQKQVDAWVETTLRIGAKKKIGGMTFEYRGGNNVARIK